MRIRVVFCAEAFEDRTRGGFLCCEGGGCQRRRDYAPERWSNIVPGASAVAGLRSPREGPARGAIRPPRGWRRPARGRDLWAHGDRRGYLDGHHWHEFVVYKGIQESDASQAEAAYPRQRKHSGAVHIRRAVTGNGGMFERRSAVHAPLGISPARVLH